MQQKKWIMNLFQSAMTTGISTKADEEHIDLSEDSSLEMKCEMQALKFRCFNQLIKFHKRLETPVFDGYFDGDPAATTVVLTRSPKLIVMLFLIYRIFRLAFSELPCFLKWIWCGDTIRCRWQRKISLKLP